MLDTHIALWTAFAPSRLTSAERKRLSAPQTVLVLSAVSVWEVRLKWHSFHLSGLRKGLLDPATLVRFAAALGWEVLPLTARHAAATLTQALPHRDPFDELLLVQVQEEGMRLITRDEKLIAHPLAATLA